jgi:ornithine cyclodeaminase/alanine dehydrogenase-like protein (mu-crystallin family)
MRRKYAIEVAVCDDARDVYRGADIVAGVTDSAVPVLNGDRIEPGCHVGNRGGGGRPDDRTLEKEDVYLRFGNAPAPWGLPEMALEDEYVTYAAEPEFNSDFRMKCAGKRGHGAALPDRMVTFKDIFEGTNRGRASSRQITYSERGNLQGAQFWAVGGVVYEKARDKGLGHEIPTEWPLQDIRD